MIISADEVEFFASKYQAGRLNDSNLFACVLTVIKFARATGDLQTLSEVDLKLIALTYTLEAQIHGTKHLRDCPPPVQTVNVRRLPEKEMPGWGSNVPNLEEWEALERESGDGSNPTSRILPLKNLNLNVIPQDEVSMEGSIGATNDSHSVNQADADNNMRKPRRFPPQKKEVNIEGKKMVANGIDASQGQFEADAGDWMPAVSRSTHRRYLRRRARREYYDALSEKESQQDVEKDAENHQFEDSRTAQLQVQESPEEVNSVNGISEETAKDTCNNDVLSSAFDQIRLEEESFPALQEGQQLSVEGDEADDAINEESDHLEKRSETNGSVESSFLDDGSSEQSWMLRSLSESSVACVTSDFAMQNVLLQMGLRMLAPGGVQIRQLHRYASAILL